MKCNQVKRQLDYYLDNLLSEKDKEEWDDHLRNCPTCREMYRSALKLRELLSEQKEVEPPSGYEKSFWPRLRARLPEARPHTFIFPVWKPVYAAAAAMVVLLAVYTGTVLRDRGEIAGITTGFPPDYVVSQVVPVSGEDKPVPDYVIGTGEKGSRDQNYVLASAALSDSPSANYW